jgi:ssDNA-binding Zn-finger/Zn-ribbon topoisomerase 1
MKSSLPILVSKPIRPIKITKRKVSAFRAEIRQYYDKNSYLSWSETKRRYIILGSNEPRNGLVLCPCCKIGKLMIIRSRKTRKRFVGCSNYYNGCRATSPLVQKAMLHPTKTPCEFCGWPQVVFRYSRKQKWVRQCSNINCTTRKFRV